MSWARHRPARSPAAFPAHRSACPGRPPAPARCARRPGAAPAASPDRRAIPHRPRRRVPRTRAPAGRKPVASPWSPGCPRASPRYRARRRAAPAPRAAPGRPRSRRTAGCRRPGRRPVARPVRCRRHPAASARDSRRRRKSCRDGSGRETVRGWANRAGSAKRRRRESGSWSARCAGADVQAGRAASSAWLQQGADARQRFGLAASYSAISPHGAAQVAFEGRARFVGRVVALLLRCPGSSGRCRPRSRAGSPRR